MKSPQIRKVLLSDVRKPTKSVKSSRKAEEQAPGGLYTLAITVETVLHLAETTIDSKDSKSVIGPVYH